MYRAYHAIRALTGPDGQPTNAVYGFVTTLRKLIADHQPELIAAAFDLRGPTFRSELAADYKANRAPMPPDLVEQVPLVHEACAALGVPVLTSEAYEADDVIGTLSKHAAADGLDVVIVTGDKDFFQLVGGAVRVFNPRDTGTWYDADGVVEKMGVDPSQVVDVLSLMGDAVDNIKGVPGIGEKGARELIGSFGSLDRLLDQADDVPKKRYRAALLGNADAARQSRTLLQISTDAPVPFEPDALRYSGPDRDRCFSLFSQLGFRTLVAEYAPTASTINREYTIVRTLAELRSVVADIQSQGQCGLHVLSDRTDGARSSLVGIALSTEPRRAYYLPLGHRALDNDSVLDEAAEALSLLGPIIADATVRKIGHDVKTDMLALSEHHLACGGFDGDTMLVSYLLDATRPAHRFEDLVLEHVGYRAIATEDVLGKGAKALGIRRSTRGGRRRLRRRACRLLAAAVRSAVAAAGTGRADRTLRRARATADPDSRCARARRCPRRRRCAARDVGARGCRARCAPAGDSRVSRNPVQYQFSQAAGRGAVRAAGAADAQANGKDARCVDVGRRARGARARPRPAAHSAGMAKPAEAQGHIPGRAPAAH